MATQATQAAGDGDAAASALERLEQLAAEANALALDFPTRRALLQHLEQLRQWQRRAVFAHVILQRLLAALQQLQQMPPPPLAGEQWSLPSLAAAARTILSVGAAAAQQPPAPAKGKGAKAEAPSVPSDPLPFALSARSLRRLLQRGRRRRT